MQHNTARLVLSSLLQDPGKAAIGDLEVSLDRNCLMANVDKQANSMLAAGMVSGDFCILLCDRGPRFWVELLAAWVIGCKPVCIQANISDDHATSAIEMTGARFIFKEGVCDTVAPILEQLTVVESTFDAALTTSDIRSCFNSLCFASDIDELAGLIFTSGTTGVPKGVPLTHAVLSMNALATAHRLRLRSEDILLIATPFRFISSISHFLVTLLSGATFFGLEKTLMIKDLIDAINELEITAFGGSPFHVQFFAMAGSERLPNLRWIMSSGDHLRPAVIDKLEQAFENLELHVVYGMAELGGRFCELPPNQQFSKKGSVGFPINGFELSVRDEAGKLCAQGEIGEIHVGGTLEFAGYYKNPDANRKVLSAYGFRNGDKGYLDEDGYLFLAGRSDSVFKRSGLKVSSQVVAEQILELPEVKDAYVKGYADDLEGQVPVAYVHWNEGVELPFATVTQRLRSMLPVNHLPKHVVTVSHIPRTGSGKVDQRKLTAIIAEIEA